MRRFIMMLDPRLICFTSALLVALASDVTIGSVRAADVDFVREVRPILVSRCYRCHSSLKQDSSLRLDSAEAIEKGGDGGAVVVPGKGAESRLLHAVEQTGELKMPPEGEPLKPAEIELIRRWIDAGAKVPRGDEARHWSFVPPQRRTPPSTRQADWPLTPIDSWIAARLDAAELAPSAPAPKHLFLRRLTLDLVGLPPTDEELQSYLADDAPDATQRVVDRLLAQPAHGERWGRHWMDVWRYSDWDGYGAEVRESQPHIWRWRDWIVESINGDKPYSQMIVEMLAGDELAPDDPQTLRATGFLVRNWFKFNRNVWLDNTIEHTGKAFVGLTFNCARCHDHMYDPLTQGEYYQLRAIFEPYDVRTDPLPGQSDVTKDGLVRAYDAKLDTPTFLFTRGDEKQPEKDKPMLSGLPRVLSPTALQTQPIALTPAAYYPGSQAHVHQAAQADAAAELKKSEAAVAAATQKLADARSKLSDFVAARDRMPPAADAKTAPAAKPGDAATPAAAAPPAPTTAPTNEATLQAAIVAAEAALADAQAGLAVAQVAVEWVTARIAADQAQYQQPAAANAKDLAKAASLAERQLAVRRAERSLLQAEQKLAAARAQLKPDDAKLQKAVTDAEAQVAAQQKARDAAAMAVNQPSDNYTRFGPTYVTSSTGRRLALARWITADENPLAPRVAVNHIWLRHFGSPLVTSVFDFGANGKAPTHPELLDSLARDLTERNWEMKRLHRQIVTSAVYRQQSSGRPNEPAAERAAKVDPENRLLWRMNVRRMEAELVRDATLLVSEQLDRQMFGPDLDPAKGMTLSRRSLYFRNSKEKKMTFLSLFDSPNVSECYRRSESIAPQQALALANSSLSLAQARILAGMLAARVGPAAGDPASQVPTTQAAFVEIAFQRILGRPATSEELAECEQFLVEQAARFAQNKGLTPFGGPSDVAVKPATDPQQRARENLIHVLLNHNDFVAIR